MGVGCDEVIAADTCRVLLQRPSFSSGPIKLLSKFRLFQQQDRKFSLFSLDVKQRKHYIILLPAAELQKLSLKSGGGSASRLKRPGPTRFHLHSFHLDPVCCFSCYYLTVLALLRSNSSLISLQSLLEMGNFSTWGKDSATGLLLHDCIWIKG